MAKKSRIKKTTSKKATQKLLPFYVQILEKLSSGSSYLLRLVIRHLENMSGMLFAELKQIRREFIPNTKIIFSLIGQLFVKCIKVFVVFPLLVLNMIGFFGFSLLKQIQRIFSFKISLPTTAHIVQKKRGRPKKKVVEQIRRHNFIRGILFNRYSFSLGVLAVLFLFFFYSYVLVSAARNLPSPERLSETNGPLTTEIYDRNGQLLYRLYEGKNRTLVSLDTLPNYLVQATVAIEDKHFYSHPGVDIEGMTRAIRDYVEEGEIKGGGSTITQQLIKNTLLTPEQTFKRKFKEVILAFWAERIFNKQEILQMYFNEVAYGGPAWGITAAAQTYFNKEPQQLTLAEATYLAGLPASPTTYSPYGANPEMGKQRQLQVLRRMVEDGYLDQESADLAAREELQINPPISQIKAPHFVMYVRQLLSQKYGERMVSQGGLKVTTTLDLKLQEMAEEQVAKEVANLVSLNVSNGAAMITDAPTGQILAMVGSKNYFDPSGGNFNVTTAKRQPGSSIKPITYVTGFKQGFTPGNLLLDTPITFKNAWESYSPVNYDGKFHGAVTVRTALGSSYNIPAVKMLSMVSIPEMITTAKDMGITTFDKPNAYGLSLTLGGGEVKMTDMMVAYGSLSQGGIKHDSESILKVMDPQNNILEENSRPEGKRVLSEDVVFFINDILADNKARTPAFGSNSLLNVSGHIVSVKTGTTDNKKDNLTYGYTPEYVVGVWVGNNDNTPMNPALTSGVTGAAPIWHSIMTRLLENRPNIAFTRPSNITEGSVDGRRDLVIAGQRPKTTLGKKQNPDPTGKNQNITYTDPFSTLTVEPNSANQTPIVITQ